MYARTVTLRLVLPFAVAVAALLALPAHASAAVPAAPSIVSPAQSRLVPSTFTITGRVGPLVTEVRVAGVPSATVTVLSADSEGATFTANVEVHTHPGAIKITIEAGDGIAWSEPATLTVWQLGRTPTAGSFVLVDKSDYMLYVVRSRRVIASYPVAIGMRGAPTPTGTRYLGRPVRAPSAVWGPFRMRLYRKAWVRVSYIARVGGHRVRRWHKVLKKVATSYYIHGTNEPDSIGTPASHGCVRMWNRNLRVFKTLTTKYELTVIRS